MSEITNASLEGGLSFDQAGSEPIPYEGDNGINIPGFGDEAGEKALARIKADMDGEELPDDGDSAEPAEDAEDGDGSSDGSEDAAQETGDEDAILKDELSPEERALERLKEDDPEAYEALMKRIQQGEEAKAAKEQAEHDAAIQKRKANGDLLADVDPDVAAAWSKEAVPKVLVPLYQEINGMAETIGAGVADGFAGSISADVVNAVTAALESGRDLSPKDIGQLIQFFADQNKPFLVSGLAEDMKGITKRITGASVELSKIAHGATVEGNKSKARREAVHGLFQTKAAEVEKSLGRKLSQEERSANLRRYERLLADPQETPQGAVDAVFSALMAGVKAGEDKGRKAATQKNTRRGHENAHRGGGKPSVKPSLQQMLESGTSIAEMERHLSSA